MLILNTGKISIMKYSPLNAMFEIKKANREDNDLSEISEQMLRRILFEISLIRQFENTMLKLAADGCVHGPVHTSIGHEACASGAMAAISPSDQIASTHRAHHHYISKAVSFAAPDGFKFPSGSERDVIQNHINSLMGEIMGLANGCCKGRGGSMHLRDGELGIIGTNAIVAGGVPLATGAAFAAKYNNSKQVTLCFLGDGAVNQGSFHEALNLASTWKLPIVYVVENNLYAVATSIRNTTATKTIAVKASAYGMKGCVVDGMDPVAGMLAIKQAVQDVRQENMPVLVEAQCYRYNHHAGPIPGSNFGYRSTEEEKTWAQRDPYMNFAGQLSGSGIISEQDCAKIKELADEMIASALNCCVEKIGEKFVVRPELMPNPDSLEIGTRSDQSEFKGAAFSELKDFGTLEDISYVDAIAMVTGRHLEKDEKVFVLGEEVANFGGGPYGATKGLPAKYPERVLNTPISECGFVGLAGGAAMSGLKPVVEIMFPDFALVAADQLFNQIGKLRHMYGNSVEMPVVARTRVAIGCGYGGQHSMDPAGLFSLFSGWRIAAPTNAFDYIGLFNSAMLSKDPVLIIEHNKLYPIKSAVPSQNLDYLVELGKAKVVRSGSDATVVSYSYMLQVAQEACKELANENINPDLIDLRTVSAVDIDYETIGQSLKKTGILVIVEQSGKSCVISAGISEQCQLLFFDYLDGPIVTICGKDVPSPVSKYLECAATPDIKSIKEIITKAVQRRI